MLNKIRRILFRTNVILGDVNAVSKGRVGRRLVRKTAYRATGKLLRRLLK